MALVAINILSDFARAFPYSSFSTPAATFSSSELHYGSNDEIFDSDASVNYPSLNILDYDTGYDYPIFPRNNFPFGISRKDMPQLEFNRTSKSWQEFTRNVKAKGGKVSIYEGFDLRLARPLQKEISGYIAYNILFDDLRKNFIPDINDRHRSQVDQNERLESYIENLRKYFTDKIVLVKSPVSVSSSKGGVIDKDSYFILDGHHTTYVAANLCSMSPHTLLRLGNFHSPTECGEKFNAKQDIYVVEGLELLKVREAALESGATTGFKLTVGGDADA